MLMLFIILSVSCVSAGHCDTDMQDSDGIESDENLNAADCGEALGDGEAMNFSSLADEIKASDGNVELTRNYTYSPTADLNYTSGITISKSIIIDGKGFTINGNNIARIFNVTAGSVILKNIIFINGNTTQNGGSILWEGESGKIINCSFKNTNAISTTGCGGAIYWNGENGTVSDCEFNSAKAGLSGGAVYWNGTYGCISHTTFNNSNSKTGGAVLWMGFCGALNYCNFTDNSAMASAGAVYWNGNNGTLNNSNFKRNYVTGTMGGAIYSSNVGNFRIVNCNFTGNYAGLYGGALSLSNVECYIDHCNFNDNHLLWNLNGGAIYWINTCENSSLITYCNFTNNTANIGCSIYTTADLNITKSVFSDLKGKNTIYSTAKIYLSENSLNNNNTITATGTVISKVTVSILEGSTVRKSVKENLTINGTICDDNTNPLTLSDIYLIINNTESIKASFTSPGVFTAEYTPSKTGNYSISVNTTGKLSDATVKTGNLIVEKADVTIDISIRNAVYPSATVSINASADGVYDVEINNINTTITVSNGMGNTTLVNLANGNHTVTVTFKGNESYNNASANKTFYVSKATNTLKVEIANVTYPTQAFATVEASADGIYTLTVNGVEYNITVTNGMGNKTLNILSANNYTAFLRFENSNYTSNENSTKFKVEKHTVKINITADNVIYPGDADIWVNADTDGVYNLSVNDENYNITVRDGVGNKTLSGLKTGSYNVTVSYSGNENCSYVSEKCSFTVSLKTFSDLAGEIAATGNGKTLKLSYDYAYDLSRDADYVSGIVINKTITIDGAGHSISGNNLSRIFYINHSSVTLKNTVLKNAYLNASDGYGGAIYWNGDYGNITNCTFMSNKVVNVLAGAVIWQGSEGVISKSRFEGNCAKSGGAITWNGTSGCLTDCVFTDNSATLVTGGAVEWYGENGEINNCNFTSNSANMMGGALYAYSTGITVSGCNFNSNNVKIFVGGGAVYLINVSATFENCNFYNNYIYNQYYLHNGNGGALYWVSDYSYVGNIINCTFRENKGSNGYSIYANATLNITGSTFTDKNNVNTIFNNGNLYLKNNTLNNNNSIYTNIGKITSQTAVVIVVNKTVADADENVSVTVTVCDDNLNSIIFNTLNLIVGDENLNTTCDSSGVMKANFSSQKAGKYTININATDKLPLADITPQTLYVKGSVDINIEIADAIYPNATVMISSQADGNYNVSVNNITYNVTVSNNSGKVVITGLNVGNYTVNVTFCGNGIFDVNTNSTTVNVKSSIASHSMKRGYNSCADFNATFYDSKGSVLNNTSVQFKIGSAVYDVISDSNGVATLNIKLNSGTYTVTSINPVTGEAVENTLTIISSLKSDGGVEMYYLDGSTYSVRVYGGDGEARK